jgi:hypothetical protein
VMWCGVNVYLTYCMAVFLVECSIFLFDVVRDGGKVFL